MGFLQRITVSEVIKNKWFKKGYQPPSFETPDVNLDDVDTIFSGCGVSFGHIPLTLKFLKCVILHFQLSVLPCAGLCKSCC